MSEQRNIIMAVVLSMAVMVGWMLLFPQAPHPNSPDAPSNMASQSAPLIPGAGQAAGVPLSRADALARSPRVKIEAPRVWGSISLKGARIDDLHLRDYHETPDPASDTIILLSPPGAAGAYYAEFGWAAPQGVQVALPNLDTVWQVAEGNELTPETPVTLTWDNGAGLIFSITYTIDANYMFSVAQEVKNASGGDVALTPYGVISRHQVPNGRTTWILHEGYLGVLAGSLKERTWKKLREDGAYSLASQGGWNGFTDKYWLTAMAPPQNEQVTASAGIETTPGDERFAAIFQLQPRIIPSAGTARVDSHFFAGAKEVRIVDGYEKALGINRFDLAIDWGWFRFLTKPLFFLLEFFKDLLGNFGLAILAVTFCVKLVLFPIANRSYETMSKMKKLQPQLKELQERYKEDRVELQRQMMGLYQKEKVNMFAGCLPVFLQIPIFFSLYKVLFVTIEMRHAPFFGWIHDLSARDPTSAFNLFGLLPYSVPDFLMIGAWPLIMGFTMFIQTSLNPQAQDPTQRLVFTWMPVIFTFMLASFPAGLVIYWTWNNVLSILQQVVIMKRLGTPIELGNTLGLTRLQRAFAGKAAVKTEAKPGE